MWSKKTAVTSVVFPCAEEEFQCAHDQWPPSTETIEAFVADTSDAVMFGGPALPGIQLSL